MECCPKATSYRRNDSQLPSHAMGKKILEWTPTPEIAMEYMVALNDKWALDGRDPNTYTGIGWVLGKFDRGWTERPVYGKIRCMTTTTTKRKFSTKKYIETYSVSPSKQQTLFPNVTANSNNIPFERRIELPLFVHEAKFDANKSRFGIGTTATEHSGE